jgi:murein DD-endopeptidase MepM/ murein hydrolase activator NlpD
MTDSSYLKKMPVGMTPGVLRRSFLLLLCLFFLAGCDSGPDGNDAHQLPSQAVLTHLPCDVGAVLWMQPYGNVDHGGGNAFFHPGIDFGTQAEGAFFSGGDGYVTQVELDTGVGSAGTNYRITIQVATNVVLDYHFEIFGDVPESQRTNNILVTAGDRVEAGQHIGNLIVSTPDLAHVHWSVLEDGEAASCPLDYFSDDAANSFETLYDSGIEKRPGSRPDLCE